MRENTSQRLNCSFFSLAFMLNLTECHKLYYAFDVMAKPKEETSSSDLRNVCISNKKLSIFKDFNFIRKLSTENFCECFSKILLWECCQRFKFL